MLFVLILFIMKIWNLNRRFGAILAVSGAWDPYRSIGRLEKIPICKESARSELIQAISEHVLSRYMLLYCVAMCCILYYDVWAEMNLKGLLRRVAPSSLSMDPSARCRTHLESGLVFLVELSNSFKNGGQLSPKWILYVIPGTLAGQHIL